MSEDNGQQGAKPEKVVAYFGEAEIEVTPDQLDVIKQERDNYKTQIRDLSGRLEQIEAEREKNRQKAAENARKAQEAELMAQGKAEEVIKAKEAEINAMRENYATRIARDRIRVAVASNPDVLKDAIDDVANIVYASARYDIETDALNVLGPDGRPTEVDSFLGELLSKKPYFRKANTSQGTGATGAGTHPTSQSTITQADLLAAQLKGGDQYRKIVAGVSKGDIVVIE